MTRLLFLAAALLAACGSVNAGSGSATASAAPTVPGGTVKVTMGDEQKTVTAHVGDHIQIALGEQSTWQLDPPDGVVLTRTVQNYMLIRGTQAIWLAAAPGTSTIHAMGTAVCPSGSACPQYAISFTATVLVVP